MSFLRIALLTLCLPSFSIQAQGLDAARQAELDNLLLQDCGSCHGLRLTGGLGPPLTQQALAGKPRDSLIATVRQGRPGTAMPGWAGLLGEQDIAWLIDRLTKGNP